MANFFYTSIKTSYVKMLAFFWHVDVTREVAEVYNEVLEPYTDEEVAKACKSYLFDDHLAPWMPTPREIANRIDMAQVKAYEECERGLQEFASSVSGEEKKILHTMK